MISPEQTSSTLHAEVNNNMEEALPHHAGAKATDTHACVLTVNFLPINMTR